MCDLNGKWLISNIFHLDRSPTFTSWRSDYGELQLAVVAAQLVILVLATRQARGELELLAEILNLFKKFRDSPYSPLT